ncbi:hypothetical protein A3A48_01225 [Candidatus Curtissbacteria bacterium RIFCSPLOWO2_01_FULL_37_9]|uniref:Uncharacterized protein n=1 Tax=Candidatus Curtissbacteria bacterium RIFCSPLOWO2_01_FULL_37_9 TaxID=1797724 RepID=A0A1F5GQL0_9BACT|nr:MAG: hypothetical protein A3A48_01225 [Candidatus Curtissbacteria bacterium RIFCSPLOWO2_01_FULL_37_9]
MSIFGNFFRGDSKLKAIKLTNEAISLLQQNDLHAAKEKAVAAINVNEEHDPAWSILATALAKQGRFEEAVESLKMAIKHNKLGVNYYLTLASTYAAQGNKDFALKTAQEAQRVFKSKKYADFLKEQKEIEKNGLSQNMVTGRVSVEELQIELKKILSKLLNELQK